MWNYLAGWKATFKYSMSPHNICCLVVLAFVHCVSNHHYSETWLEWTPLFSREIGLATQVVSSEKFSVIGIQWYADIFTNWKWSFQSGWSFQRKSFQTGFTGWTFPVRWLTQLLRRCGIQDNAEKPWCSVKFGTNLDISYDIYSKIWDNLLKFQLLKILQWKVNSQARGVGNSPFILRYGPLPIIKPQE